jgi:isopentenyl diphosphate isomerase/L-lactate dehydrogenase-like FMN-dependent dehydrogenase
MPLMFTVALYCGSLAHSACYLHRAGYKALCITVDAPMLGRRERDMRNKAAAAEV